MVSTVSCRLLFGQTGSAASTTGIVTETSSNALNGVLKWMHLLNRNGLISLLAENHPL